jgi:hypothetical protein
MANRVRHLRFGGHLPGQAARRFSARHPLTPALSLPELVAQATLDGPVSRAVDHVRDRTGCGVLGICPAGETRLAEKAFPR